MSMRVIEVFGFMSQASFPLENPPAAWYNPVREIVVEDSVNTCKTVTVLVTALFVTLAFSACSSPSGNNAAIVMEMVQISGGTFQMGSPTDEPDRGNDEVQYSVKLSAFSMGKYEVTQGQYQAVMGSNPSSGNSYGVGGNYPVYNVSWYDAIVFCNKLSMREGLSPAYSISGSTDPADWGTVPISRNATWNAVQVVSDSTGYRLPTEAQWEYACRAGTTTPFSTGNNITTAQANYNGSYPYNYNPAGIYRARTTEVGSFDPNAWGLYDMHGNVWEWCWDWYGNYPSGASTDPDGAASGTYRVRRGGSWYIFGQFLRSALRFSYYPYSRINNLGFRVVLP